MKNGCFRKHPLKKSLFGVPALHVLTLRPVTLRATCRDTMSDLSKSSWSIGNSGRAHMILLMEEIRRSPVEVGSLSHGFCISRVVQDFFHQQYLARLLQQVDSVPKEICALSCTSIFSED